jgi:hypothetical protein
MHIDQQPYRTLYDGMNYAERLELLRFRCFIRCAKPHDDRWPYDDSLIEE